MGARGIATLGLLAAVAGSALGQADSEFAPLGQRITLSRGVAPYQVTDALGDIKGNYDVQTFIGETGCLGVEQAWGFFWVSARTLVAGTPHRIGKFDMNGVGLAEYDQLPKYDAAIANATLSPWGGRDGAADEANNKLYFGHEAASLSSYTYNPGTGAITPGTTITIPGLAGTVRALAYNPTNGHFYTADFFSVITEFTINPPAVVTQYPNLTGPGGTVGAIYGLAYDPVNNTMWAWSQNACEGGTGNTRSVYAAELNITTMAQTGRSFCGWLSGGVDNISGGADVYCGDPHNPGKLSFVGLHQTTTDAIVVYDLDENCGVVCYPDCNGDGQLNLADFGCFQTKFALGDPYADCNGDGVRNLSDFGCFQTKFALGCP